ncbi:MAG: alpha/beta fold hydrolase [Syntrophobacteraceae bacterium]
MNSTTETEGSLRLTAADGYPIGAVRLDARAPLKGNLVVAGATGVPQGFYRRFAEYASSSGFNTLTFDYRGVGASRPGNLKGFTADFLDWAQLDLAAAVKAMADAEIPLYLVGHSFAGHAFGLLPNHHLVSGFYTFGSGSGWHGWMSRLEGLKVLLLWTLVCPPMARWYGYLPMSRLGMGENLPLGVYRQWRHWCRFPRYFFDDPAVAEKMREKFAGVKTPIAAANSLDDAWITSRARDAFMQGYSNAKVERIDIDPAPFGGLGHMGYFRAKAEPLWEDALAWLSKGRICTRDELR